MLWSRHTLYVAGRVEVAHVTVGRTETIVARTRRILNVAYRPVVVACQLEGADTLALLVALEAHVVILHRLAFEPALEETARAIVFRVIPDDKRVQKALDHRGEIEMAPEEE